MNKYIIEFIGTFFLILIIAFSADPIAIGLGLAALVYMGGYISGAQYNPAVTLAIFLTKKMDGMTAVRYVLIQFVAAIAASGVYFFVRGSTFVPQPNPDASFFAALLVEALFTFLLATVVLHTAATEKTKGNDYYGFAIGVTVLAAAFAGGPISGGAFNPAVGIGPLLFDFANISHYGTSMLLYLIGPLVGATVAAVIYKLK